MAAKGDDTVTEKTQPIADEIERTRLGIEDTAAAIETRLSPARLKEQISNVKEHAVSQLREAKDQLKTELERDLDDAKHRVKDEIVGARAAMRDATVGKVEHMALRVKNEVSDVGSTVVDTVRANPIPAALVGFGLAWLVMSARSSSGGSRMRVSRLERYPQRIRERTMEGASHFAHDAKEKMHDIEHRAVEIGDRVGQRLEGARDAAEHLVDDARERAEYYVDEGKMQIYRAQDRMERVMDESPLAVGAVAFALGAAVGLAIPTTQAEDRIFGEAKERLVSKAENAARGAIHTAEERAAQAMHKVGASSGKEEGEGAQRSETFR